MTTLAALLVLCCGMMASSRTVHLPPIPRHEPGRGNAAIAAHQYISLDESSAELVITYPLPPGHPSGRHVRTWRMALATAIDPSVKVGIQSRFGHGVYSYSYQIANGSRAKEGIYRVVIANPSLEAVASLSGPRDWFADKRAQPPAFEPGYLEAVVADWPSPYAEEVSKRIVRKRIEWKALAETHLIAPGKTMQGFQVISRDRPGLSQIYFSGIFIPIGYEGEDPETVAIRLNSLGYLENNSISLLTLTPKFAPTTPSHEIARDYLHSIDRLISQGQVSAASPFIRALKPILETYATTGQRSQPKVFPAVGAPPPSNDCEEAILLGVTTSLSPPPKANSKEE